MVFCQSGRERISRLRSMATRPASRPSSQSKSVTVEPGFAERCSPLTVMVSIGVIPSLVRGRHSRPGAQLETQMSLIAHGNLKKSAFAGEPRLGVEQLEVERIRPRGGIRPGFGSRDLLVRWNSYFKFAGTNLFDDAAMLLAHAEFESAFALGVEW